MYLGLIKSYSLKPLKSSNFSYLLIVYISFLLIYFFSNSISSNSSLISFSIFLFCISLSNNAFNILPSLVCPNYSSSFSPKYAWFYFIMSSNDNLNIFSFSYFNLINSISYSSLVKPNPWLTSYKYWLT